MKHRFNRSERRDQRFADRMYRSAASTLVASADLPVVGANDERWFSPALPVSILCPDTTTLCRYCFNLDHWIPVHQISHEIECRRCPDCPMYVPPGLWHDHEGHAASYTLVRCSECPSCGGMIPPGERDVECRFCEVCKSYVPLNLWETHEQSDIDDPFIK